jgi:hypothetical protein
MNMRVSQNKSSHPEAIEYQFYSIKSSIEVDEKIYLLLRVTERYYAVIMQQISLRKRLWYCFLPEITIKKARPQAFLAQAAELV